MIRKRRRIAIKKDNINTRHKAGDSRIQGDKLNLCYLASRLKKGVRLTKSNSDVLNTMQFGSSIIIPASLGKDSVTELE
jgi:hypothetical protein